MPVQRSGYPEKDDKQARAAVELLADEMNQLAMAVESLAAITPNTERQYAKDRRHEARVLARRCRERIAELIPE